MKSFDLDKYVSLLQAKCPTSGPVEVRVRKLKECYGYTEEIKGRFKIVVRRMGCHVCMRDTLAHEWAHVLAWGDKAMHGALWGRMYAKCYRAVS